MYASSQSSERSVKLSKNSDYVCSKCNAPLLGGSNRCSVCGEMFSQPVPVDNSHSASSPGNFVSAKNINHPSGQASFTAPFVAPKSDLSSPALWKRIIRGAWYVFLVFIAIGAIGEIRSGETSALWVFAVLGLPTLWLHKRLNTRVKTIASGVFALITIGCVIFSNTPQGKAAHATFQQQIAHDQRVAAQKQQQQQAEDAKRQAQEDKAEAKKKALEAKEQAKQDEAQKAQDAENEAQQAKEEQSSTSAKIGAYLMAQQFVDGELKSPGSAKYPDYSEDYVQLTGDNTYSVSAYVDSQNGFGALIRTSWKTTVINEGNDKWRCKGVDITGSTE